MRVRGSQRKRYDEYNLLNRVLEMSWKHPEQASEAKLDAGTNLLDAGSRKWLPIDTNLMIRSGW